MTTPTVMEMPSPSSRPLWSRTVRTSPMPWLRRSGVPSSGRAVPGGPGRPVADRPLHARITALCRCRWISDSSWFHSRSCSVGFRSRPSSWICWILQEEEGGVRNQLLPSSFQDTTRIIPNVLRNGEDEK